MHIDNSRYTAFLANPERYRLTYELNLVPKETPFALARGIYFHSLNEARNKGMSPEAAQQLAMKNQVSLKARQSGEALFAAFKRRYDGDTNFELAYDDGKPLAEVEFDLQIPGSPHYITGKMDEIVQYKGELWVGDTKTANDKATEGRKKAEFGYSSQGLFYINAARMLGYPVKGMLYRVVTEHRPPQHWVIPVVKSERTLQVGLLNIHQVAEQIEMMRRTFGPDMPWPHTYQAYPCNYETAGKPACEYANICMKRREEMCESDLEDFVIRDEHLEVMKQYRNDNKT